MYNNWIIDNSVYIIESTLKNGIVLYMKEYNQQKHLKTINIANLDQNIFKF